MLLTRYTSRDRRCRHSVNVSQLIQWLVINLPGGPETWREHLPHLISGLAGYSTPALRELKEYAAGQIEVYKREKAHFEKMLAELSKR